MISIFGGSRFCSGSRVGIYFWCLCQAVESVSTFDGLCQAVESVSTFDGWWQAVESVSTFDDLYQAVESVSTFDGSSVTKSYLWISYYCRLKNYVITR